MLLKRTRLYFPLTNRMYGIRVVHHALSLCFSLDAIAIAELLDLKLQSGVFLGYQTVFFFVLWIS